ncbi:23S rRNA (uracil(1939)-C(5))-methyltransferase RlmD [Persephonella atlantica]|uniref:23S rRNA (Uracil(1939)-C(5))-methyltransferase RlmD n=1 Tax=Persephonella atlantica TaxID=2699429 RepID=A0ABS1GGR9_9AQUI|nr:23S rRNA (uracil(1939)-C(5))-methyltransferase RlmD [Persephonella atlantica]MBK3332098.1 23S rRNA (uracil(1939)-C(5))-methyltransferase RlmD [Persephonella atlantica]
MKVKVEKLVYGGKGLGRIDEKVCFIPFVIPGEEVEVKITEEKKSFLECEPVNVLKPSPYRTKPICQYFGYCGGCDYLHIDYSKQVEQKNEIFAETVKRIGKIESVPLLEPIPSPFPTHYRNRVQFKVKGERIGFYRKESRDIVNIHYCYLIKEELNSVISSLKEILPFFGYFLSEIHLYSSSENQMVMKLLFNKPVNKVPLSLKHMKAFLTEDLNGYGIYLKTEKHPKKIQFIGTPFVYETVKDYRFRVSADSFFQVNRFQIENLIRLVEDEVKEENIKVAFDLYCGVGTFTIPIARYVDKVYGVEVNPYAVQDANHNKKLNKTQNAFFKRASASEALSYMVKKNPELILVDPPRTGLDRNTIEVIDRIKQLKKIIYISCNPSTLARDLNLLKEKGFRLISSRFIDMFPNTYHIESFSVLERLNKS